MFEIYSPVTVWKLNGKHNHIEYGWVSGETPSARFDNQRIAWNKEGWVKKHMYLKSVLHSYVKTTLLRNGYGYNFMEEKHTPLLVNMIE